MHGSLTGTQAVYLTGCLCVDLELEGDLSMAFENFFVLFFFFFFFWWLRYGGIVLVRMA
jgi:hypothetical protein